MFLFLLRVSVLIIFNKFIVTCSLTVTTLKTIYAPSTYTFDFT